jgi:hypothetical protein
MVHGNIHTMSMTRKQDHSTKPVRAHVVLKGPAGGVTSSDEPISASNVEEYHANSDIQEQVRSQLEDLGLSVTRVSPLTAIVEASPEQLETAFHGRLQKVKDPQLPSDVWMWSEFPEIPEGLRDKVDTVVFPHPARILR